MDKLRKEYESRLYVDCGKPMVEVDMFGYAMSLTTHLLAESGVEQAEIEIQAMSLAE